MLPKATALPVNDPFLKSNLNYSFPEKLIMVVSFLFLTFEFELES